MSSKQAFIPLLFAIINSKACSNDNSTCSIVPFTGVFVFSFIMIFCESFFTFLSFAKAIPLLRITINIAATILFFIF